MNFTSHGITREGLSIRRFVEKMLYIKEYKLRAIVNESTERT